MCATFGYTYSVSNTTSLAAGDCKLIGFKLEPNAKHILVI